MATAALMCACTKLPQCRNSTNESSEPYVGVLEQTPLHENIKETAVAFEIPMKSGVESKWKEKEPRDGGRR